MTRPASHSNLPELKVAVCEPGRLPRRGWVNCEIDQSIRFSTESIESYAFSRWEPVVFDAMVVAASVEFADLSCRRSTFQWCRCLSLRVPVDDPARWEAPAVKDRLLEALEFVTGDHWSICFLKREGEVENSVGDRLGLFPPSKAVIAFSEGMDSLAVAGLARAEQGNDVVRVRVGGPREATNGNGTPFTSVPYRVKPTRRREPTVRSRGFKFAMIAGLAAYLTRANRVIMPESGQGALGAPLVTVGHAYPDYRSHPKFTRCMERFLEALLGQPIRYDFPRLWFTKAETLKRYVAKCGDGGWRSTRSCWRDARWTSVAGSWRHCGICAACMLRRVSVHAAGLAESPETYVCIDMSSATLEAAVDPRFDKLSRAFREYAIAGVRHMDDLADMAGHGARGIVRRNARALARVLRRPRDTEGRLIGLLERHAIEWKRYLCALAPGSFVHDWVRSDRCS